MHGKQRRACLSFLAACLCLCHGRYAGAVEEQHATSLQPTPLVGLAVEEEAGLEAALRAELQALGFRTVSVSESALPGDPASIERLAHAIGAVAVVRVVGGSNPLEIWIADVTTKKILLRHVLRAASNAQQAIVLQVVELLRASFLQAVLPERFATAEAPPAAALPISVKHALQLPIDSPWRMGVGVAGLLASAALAPSVLATGEVVYQTHALWGAELLALVTLRAATLEASGDSASIATSLVGAGPRIALWAHSEKRVNASLAIGACALHAVFRGQAAAPLRGVEQSVWDACGFGRVTLQIPLSRGVHLVAQAAGIATARAVQVDFADSEVATWGRPLVLAGILVQVLIP